MDDLEDDFGSMIWDEVFIQSIFYGLKSDILIPNNPIDQCPFILAYHLQWFFSLVHKG